METYVPYVGCALDTGPKRAPASRLAHADQTDFVASCTNPVVGFEAAEPGGPPAMPVTNPALPLPAADLERTCLPLEQATMLPAAAYTDYAVFEWERANFFAKGWICAGHVEQVARRGDFLTIEAGGENVLIVGDDDGLPRAFLNTCRHRGARLVIAPAGTLRRIQCPYHAWTYGFDGSLKSAPFTDGLADFDPACFSLHEVRLAI